MPIRIRNRLSTSMSIQIRIRIRNIPQALHILEDHKFIFVFFLSRGLHCFKFLLIVSQFSTFCTLYRHFLVKISYLSLTFLSLFIWIRIRMRIGRLWMRSRIRQNNADPTGSGSGIHNSAKFAQRKFPRKCRHFLALPSFWSFLRAETSDDNWPLRK
jgi:hypothetical protein